MRGTILVVDDDATVRGALAGALEAEGYATHRSADAAAALAIVDRHHVDLMLTDVVLPGLDGVALVHAVRERAPQMPVILVSGIVEGVTLPETPFVAKPVELAPLLAAVARLLRATS